MAAKGLLPVSPLPRGSLTFDLASASRSQPYRRVAIVVVVVVVVVMRKPLRETLKPLLLAALTSPHRETSVLSLSLSSLSLSLSLSRVVRTLALLDVGLLRRILILAGQCTMRARITIKVCACHVVFSDSGIWN